MGIYDRDYYRKEGPSFLESFTGQGRICKWLIALTTLVFVAQHLTPPSPTRARPRPVWNEDGQLVDARPAEEKFGDRYGLVNEAFHLDTDAVLGGQVWRLLSYAFLHAEIFHILFNLLFLWWFGHEMEELYGAREFLSFYLVSVLAGGLAYSGWSWVQHSPGLAIGASGGVTAVLVLHAFHYPTRMIYIYGILPIPIWLFVAFQVCKDTLIWASGTTTQVAVTCHLGGALFGLLYYKFNWRLAPIWNSLGHLTRRQPRLRVFREEPPETPRRPAPEIAPAPRSAPVEEADEQLEAKVDAVLEKVARQGRDSLSESEKALLVRASEVYKRKQRQP